MNFLNLKNYFYIMKNTFKKKSLNRILQEVYSMEKTVDGSIIEFGAEAGSSKNFTNFVKLKDVKKIIYCDKFPKNNETIEEDLENRLSLEDNSIDNIIIFNVLEHVFNTENALLEINRCLKKNSGTIMGSTPFMHRVHGAPEDYSRYTKQYFEKILHKTNFTNITVENLGFGAFTSAYAIIFDYLKLIPFLNNIVLTFCLILDKFISLIVKTKTKNIYPIAVCFMAEKK
jgi:SAM-dependent methyltransferase